MKSNRTESDSIGEIDIDDNALWGASTQRAIENFPISTRRFSDDFISSLALIKRYAAEVNLELKLIDKKIADSIVQAATDVYEGKFSKHFPVDIFQTGSGTSTNMNMNEVVASVANLESGGTLGTWDPVHPNDHVNMGQSSNDVMPSALHIAALIKIKTNLLPSLAMLHKSLQNKSEQFKEHLKIGRTHLMDALPITLGQEFSGWARQIELCIKWISSSSSSLGEVAIGGTAVGTGVGAHPNFSKLLCKKLSKHLDIEFIAASNSFEALSSHNAAVYVSGSLKTLAVALTRIADDIRLLASGPRLGFAEIELPALQPGSSIMPGKVNPVIPEMVTQVATQVIANDTAIAAAGKSGHLELNTQLPVIASNLLESINLLSNASKIFSEQCIDGITAFEDRLGENIKMSLAMATALVPKIGYERAAGIAKMAHASGKSVRDIALEENLVSESELDKILDLKTLVNIK
ncbi:MAG: class II fumarate hydratase [Deltaproteobacteria bacterium]|jgi:fumarate hydratase, class II|nr:class II fumarate hydratase [Deltaproteobacteria bacterium]